MFYVFYVCFIGRREVINQTSFVDVSVVRTTTVGFTTSIPILERSTTAPASETASQLHASESPDSPVPSDTPSMFSTSMAPPRQTPAGQEEELITTVAPTIKEEDEETDGTTIAPEQELRYTTEGSDATESVSEPTEEPDDHSVIEISTIQPDVPIPDDSLNTEAMFAVGKTEETIVDPDITTAMTSDLTDVPTEPSDLTSEEVLSSSEATSSPDELHSTTLFPDYGLVDETETHFHLEALAPTQPPPEDSTPPSSDSTSIIERTTVVPTDTTFMCNTRPGQEVSHGPGLSVTTQDAETPAEVTKEKITPATESAATIPIDSGTSAEDVTSSVSVFDESATRLPEHSGDTLTEDNAATEIDREFFTSAPMASTVATTTTTPSTLATDEQSIQVTTVMQMQNVSGKTEQQYNLKYVFNEYTVTQILLSK